jgi:hypothetical protein
MKIFKYAVVLFILLMGQKAFCIEEKNSSENEFTLQIDNFNKVITLQYLNTLNNKIDSVNLIQLRKQVSNENFEINLFFKLLDQYRFSKTKENLSLKIDSIKKIVSNSNNFNLFFHEIENLNLNSLKVIDKYYLAERKRLAPNFQSSIPEVNRVVHVQQLENQEINLFDIKNIIILILFILIVVYFILNQKLNKKIREQRSKIEDHKNQLKSTYNNHSDSNNSINNLQSKIKELDKQITDLKIKLEQKENDKTEFNEPIINVIPEVSNPEKIEAKIKYFKAPISDGSFSKNHQSDTIEFANTMFKFEIQKDEKRAKFEFCGDEKVIKHAINFSDLNIEKVCDYVNTKNNFRTQIINIEPGIVELDGNKWIVKQKAKIKFA